jgi:glyoxylase-like metal-dependent hydrolase (beta-lactamase superfamily II)
MKIHALSTGTVRLKRAFLHARKGPRRQIDLFLPGPWSGPVPIHCWAIEHAGKLTLVDTGETAGVHDIPFARFDVTPEQELPGVLAAAGLSIDDVDSAVVTHLHGDHMDGAVHLRCPVLVHRPDLEYARTFGARFFQRLFRQPVPESVAFQPVELAGGAFGAFEQSLPLTDDGRIVAVTTPGHTVGHISVVCIDDEGRHVLLAGDTTDTLEQLQARRPDAVSPKPAVAVATMERIIEHGRRHPTVYLPSHDVETVTRLEAGTTL